MTRLSLRLRILLFFGLLAGGGLVILAGGLALGYRQVGGSATGFMTAFVATGFGLLALIAGIWLLFDENVAKPLERLAAQMRARAHGGHGTEIDLDYAKYLGDLAPAAAAVTEKLSDSTFDTAALVAQQTAALSTEKDRLEAILTGVPVAVMIVSEAHQLILYDGQSADILEAEAPARLNAPLFDYFEPGAITSTLEDLERRGDARQAIAIKTRSGTVLTGHIRLMGEGAGYMLMLEPLDPEAERPLTYDFDLLDQEVAESVREMDLKALTYVVFDSETTGLDPEVDEIVQLGAVRVVNGRIVPGEEFETLVNPGRPIPAASTRVHGIDDGMVAGAPAPTEAVAGFAKFAEGAVLVAHNAPFDLAFLRRAGAGQGFAFDHPVLDTVLLSAAVFGASETHTLDALSERLSVEIPAALRHTALGDAVATAEVLTRLLPILQGRGTESFGATLVEVAKHQNIVRDMNG